MLKLDPLRVFVEVVRGEGFTAAARRLGMPRSTVSLQVQALEASLGVRLFKRSTRSVALTDDGSRLYHEAASALDALAQAVEGVRHKTGTLSGLIRLTAPGDFPTAMLARAITDFTRQHPAVRFDVTLTNAKLDLVAENIDIAIRVGSSAQEAVERPLLTAEWIFCAATAWIERHGEPAKPGDISTFISPPPPLRAYLEHTLFDGEKLPPPAVTIDSHVMARDLVACGFGIALLPLGLCEENLREGKVRRVLEGHIPRRIRLAIAFPTRADMVPRVRAFADLLQASFAGTA